MTPRLKVTKQDLPLESWKKVVVRTNGIVLSGVQNYPMSLSEDGMIAFCLRSSTHTPPQDGCSCGLWSLQTVDLDVPHKDWIASVANAGKIEVGNGVMRAGWQRVLALYAPTQCSFCNGEAEEYGPIADVTIKGVCHTHARTTPEIVDRQSLQELIPVPIVWPIPKPSVLRPNPAYQDDNFSDKVAEGEGWNAVGLPIEFVESWQPGMIYYWNLATNGQGPLGYPGQITVQFQTTDKGLEIVFQANGGYIQHRTMIHATRRLNLRRM